MKKIFLAIVYVSAFSLLFKGTSNASSLEVFLFTGHIVYEETVENKVLDPLLPKIGDKFVGRLSYVYDPMLKPVYSDADYAVYEPDNSYNFLFEDFNITGIADIISGYGPAGEGMHFHGFEILDPFYIEDIYIEIGDAEGLFDITDSSRYFIRGIMDWVSYSSIPLNSQPAPEPASFILLGFGLLGYVVSKYRRMK